MEDSASASSTQWARAQWQYGPEPKGGDERGGMPRASVPPASAAAGFREAPIVCKFFLKGACVSNPCRFSHGVSGPSQGPTRRPSPPPSGPATTTFVPLVNFNARPLANFNSSQGGTAGQQPSQQQQQQYQQQQSYSSSASSSASDYRPHTSNSSVLVLRSDPIMHLPHSSLHPRDQQQRERGSPLEYPAHGYPQQHVPQIVLPSRQPIHQQQQQQQFSQLQRQAGPFDRAERPVAVPPRRLGYEMGPVQPSPYARGGPTQQLQYPTHPSHYQPPQEFQPGPPVRPRGAPIPGRRGGHGGFARGAPAVSGLTDDAAPSSKKVNCQLFALGKCKKGSTCVFVHERSVDTLLTELADEGDEGDEDEEIRRARLELNAQSLAI